MLADEDAAIIKAFDVVNESFANESWYGIALPIIFVTDKRGVVAHRFSEASYRNRPNIDFVLSTIK